MIDSHAHLIWDSFTDDIDDIITNAQKAGITKIVHPCVELKDLDQMQVLRDKYNNIYLSAGVHPCHASTWQGENNISKNIIRDWQDKIVSIGETGLDYYYKDTPAEIQQESFQGQIDMAKELDLPIIVHCRDAFEDTYKMLKNNNITRGVLHCYTGNLEYAQKFIDLGLYISWSGCVTFKNSHDLRNVAQNIPLENTLTETDSPFLAPQGNRGKRNEPKFMIEIIDLLSQLHNKTTQEIDRITTANAEKLFKI